MHQELSLADALRPYGRRNERVGLVSDEQAHQALVAFSLGSWLRRARDRRGLSQEAVALAAGLAVTTYARIERSATADRLANPTLGTFVRLAIALDVTVEELAELLGGLNDI